MSTSHLQDGFYLKGVIVRICLLFFFASVAFANGVPQVHLGSGTITNSCQKGGQEFTSVADWFGFDPGIGFSYSLKFTASGEKLVVADRVVISSFWVNVFGRGITAGRSKTYEDCPSRDACEGFCCDGSDSWRKAEPPRDYQQKWPTKTEMILNQKNGDRVELSYSKALPRGDLWSDTELEGKIIKDDGCVLTWKDKLVMGKKPADY